MEIRPYQQSDCKVLTELFYNTVHTVNAKDYTEEQLNAWAPRKVDLEKWNKSLQEHYSIVAVENGMIIGFGDIDKTGYLDRLFVHTDYQGKGVASLICDQMEQAVMGNITTHASVTAKPFFEKRGYIVVKKQKVERRGVFLTNYVMEKKTIKFQLNEGSCGTALFCNGLRSASLPQPGQHSAVGRGGPCDILSGKKRRIIG